MVDSNDVKKALDTIKESIVDPDIERLKFIKFLADKNGNEVLSDLSNDEIKCIALFRALDSHLKQENDVLGLPSINVFFTEIIKLRASKDRESRKELVACIKGHSPVYNYGSAALNDDEKKPGLMDKFAFWKKRD
jgi:hypothetical protein